ncbi:chaplin family protein [Nonomuraea sp. NPDC049784]|uniref:chaplin family protein n=1 Tax=Nonomuraea sp. NPDC049784 TaxID=3154361 RepID=UPI0033CB87CB
MRTWAKASTPAALLAVAVMSFGGTSTALADTSGDGSVGGGNQVDLPISLPIDISGNSIAAVGSSHASSQGGATVVNRGGISNKTSGNGSVLGGNQITAPISAPINACGNAVSLIGKSDAGCKGGATVRNQGKGGAGGNRTSGDGSVLGGNQITAPISAPLNVCGNAVAIFGEATAGCKGGSSVHNTGVGAGGNRTSGNGSVLGGNQVIAPISAPINICGNSVAVLGRAFAGCKGGSTVSNNGGSHGYHKAVGSTGNDTDGRFGVGSGNQVIAPISLPVDVCGNAVGNAPAGCLGGAKVENSGGGSGAADNVTSGRGGVLAGNQVVAPITAPINVCGNAVAVLGHAFAGCKGGASVKNGGRGAGGNYTSGRGGVLAGNQVIAPITAPINICGNAAAVLGRSDAHCKGGAKAGNTGGGGNRTSGRGGVLAGNQVIAPITAPINVCGNAVAVLGDAAAGCLGGANVGKPEHGGPIGYGHFSATATKEAKRGLLPTLPAVPAMGGLQDVAGVTQKVQGVGGVPQQLGVTSLPLVEDVSSTFGLPGLPELPGLPAQAQAPAHPKKTRVASSADGARRPATPAGAVSVLDPATQLVASTPVGGAVTSATRGLPVNSLPVSGLGLMSAEQPAGLTGMNSSSLLALVLGSMFAASAALFATARRFRFGRK